MKVRGRFKTEIKNFLLTISLEHDRGNVVMVMLQKPQELNQIDMQTTGNFLLELCFRFMLTIES